MAINLTTSSQTEKLLEAFISDSSSINPLEKRWVITSGKGIRTWLKQSIATKTGISANLSFLSPEQAVWSFPNFKESKNFVGRQNPFSKERLAWKIRYALPKIYQEQKKAFEQLEPFLKSSDPLKRVQLCWEIATVFDNYLHYRPDMLEKWEDNVHLNNCSDELWQAPLWRRISSLMPCPTLKTLMKEGDFGDATPKQLFFFYLAPLSPLHSEALVEYASEKTLHLYLLQPTDQYWVEVLSNKEKLKQQAEDSSSDDLYLELGPPLLGALGKSWQKQIFQLENLNSFDPNFITEKSDVEETNALSALQNLFWVMPEKKDLERSLYVFGDDSVQFHSCHGPIREVQILYDFLLDQFAKNPDLKPNEILVLCPNLQKYSALIQAIFDNPEIASRKIPYGMCDREWRSESRVIDAFYHLLEFAESRATARDFYTLICRPALREKFDLGDKELSIIHWWIEENKIAWGFDAEHKKSFNLPGCRDNTWQLGVDRMLLGFCGGKTNLDGFEEINAFDEIEGEKTELLSRLIQIIDSLKTFYLKCKKDRAPGKWQKIIDQYCLDKFFCDNEQTHRDLVEIRKSLSFLTNETEEGMDTEPLSVVRLHLEKTLNEKSLYSRHLTDGVTFSSLRSARGIPAKIICLLGMNGGEFPTSRNLASFDICRSKRKYTDRNETEEDRLLVLEAILCARQKLYLSFQGQSNKNNDLIPPSVVVDEILEQLDELLEFPSESAIRSSKNAFWVEHPLQAFSKNLFKENEKGIKPKEFFSPLGCKSFSQASCDGARALVKESNDQEKFWSENNHQSFDIPQKIPLIELKSFWRNPSTYFLEKVLHIATQETNNLLPECERLENSAWEDSSIKRKLINKFLEESPLEECYEQFQKENHLPPGQLGISLYQALIIELRLMFQRTVPNFSNKVSSTSIEADFNNIKIDGETGTFFEEKSFFFNGSKMKGKFCMEGLVQHLFNNAFSPFKGRVTTVVGATDKSFSFFPLDETTSKNHLYKLIELYNCGITNPLPFFPNSSLAWLEQTINHRKRKPTQRSNSPLTCAQIRWSKNSGGEKYDFANKLLYQDDPWQNENTANLNDTIMGLVDELGEFLPC